MFFLGLQRISRDEHRKVAVLKAELLDLGIKPVGDALPDAERPRTQHVTSTDIIVLDHFGLCYDLRTVSDAEKNSTQSKIYAQKNVQLPSLCGIHFI